MKKIFGIILIILLVLSCKNGINIEKKEEVQKEKTPTEIVKEKVNNWNNYVRNKNIEELGKIIGEKIDYYKISTTKENYLKNKKNYFDKHSTFGQEIKDDVVEIKDISDKQYKATFTKIVTTKDGTKEYPVILIFEKIENEWKLIMEDSTDGLKKTTNEYISIKSRMEKFTQNIQDQLDDVGYIKYEAVEKLSEKWENELTRIYKMLMSELSEDEKIKLRDEQRAWIKKRESNRKEAEKSHCGEGGCPAAAYYLLFQIEIEDVLKTRTLELAKMYDDLNK